MLLELPDELPMIALARALATLGLVLYSPAKLVSARDGRITARWACEALGARGDHRPDRGCA